MSDKKFPKANVRIAKELYHLLGCSGVERLADLSTTELYQTVQLAAAAAKAGKEGVRIRV